MFSISKKIQILLLIVFAISCGNNDSKTGGNVHFLEAYENDKAQEETIHDVDNSSIELLHELVGEDLLGKVNDSYFIWKDSFPMSNKLYDSLIVVEYGRIFNDEQHHLIFKRFGPIDYTINVYRQNDELSLTRVLSYEGGRINYVNDTVADVNGDDLRDFIISWQPSSGCCLRDVKNVYLQKQDSGIFTTQYEFINPDFITQEKSIRGVLYGRPGEVGMYDYKWNGYTVDTIDFLYPNLTDSVNRTYWLTSKPLYLTIESDRIWLSRIPEKYTVVKGLDWFEMY